MSVKLTFDNIAIDAPAGKSLFDYADELDIRVPTSCYKLGKCRECLVEVIEGMDLLTPKSPEEEHLKDNFRLSCRAKIAAEEGTLRCHTLRRSSMRIEEGAEEGLGIGTNAPLDPAVTRDGDTVRIDGEPAGEYLGAIHGIALDLGTTTVVMRLVDLESGRAVATQSFENPQRFGGSDIMSRIQYDTEHRGRLLQRTLLGYVTRAIERFPCEPETIYEIIVAGNSTMRDLFFGLSVETIGQKPYYSQTEHDYRAGKVDTTGLSIPAKRLRLPVNPAARVVGLPLIGCHVGADTAACLLAVDMDHEERLVALMDIGTNTELIVGNKDRILAASCPAGPAFEGGAISCGMPGLDGAIERVRIGEDGSVQTQVIGDLKPEGICGSGLIDALGELLRTGQMNTLGRLDDEVERFVIDSENDLFVSEADINELAQAKGANVAGLHIVLHTYGIEFERLDRFYLAGGFARHLEVEAARCIGLIPNLPDDKIVQVGNATIEGATIALRSATRRRELDALVKTIEHVRLETHPEFFDCFVEGCQFIPVVSRQFLEAV